MSSNCLTTTLPVASLSCGRPSGSVWWLLGSTVRHKLTLKRIIFQPQHPHDPIMPCWQCAYCCLCQAPIVSWTTWLVWLAISPYPTWSGAGPTLRLLSVLYVLLCCTSAIIYVVSASFEQLTFLPAYRECSCSTWWTTSAWPTTQRTCIQCGVKRSGGAWPSAPCSASL